MPELPEVETVRIGLEQSTVGRVITEIVFQQFADVMGGLSSTSANDRLSGQMILGVRRRAKYLIVDLDSDDALLIHLRMTGRLLVVPSTQPPIRFEHLAIVLDNGTDLRFGDQRKFGRVLLVDRGALVHLDSRLGFEPLGRGFTATVLHNGLRRRHGKLKNILLDQGFVAGLGNIYVDEALFRARLHPLRPASTITLEETRRLHRAIRTVLRQGIANQGTTFSSFENPYGEQGSNASRLQVYGKGRTGGDCPRCGHPLERLVVGGRGTTVCPTCQPRHGDHPPTPSPEIVGESLNSQRPASV